MKKIIVITQTAVMLALLIGLQFVSHTFGQFVTGSLVNMVLLVTVFVIGLYSGAVIALVSPFLAVFMGVGPALIQIVPLIAIGNVVFVLLAWLVRKNIGRRGIKPVSITVAGLAAASAVKASVLWLSISIVALPLLPGTSDSQIAAISMAFSWPQLVTALTGSVLAMIIVPVLKKANSHML